MKYDVAVIGGGPAGLAAALSAYEHGAKKVVIVERDRVLGGILNQCIHNGFGLHHFKEELTGPEYAGRFVQLVRESSIEVLCDCMVLSINDDNSLTVVGPETGLIRIEAGALVLAMGCRERTRGAISVPGDRPSGVFTAGAAQRYINIEGYMVGKRVVILGSGDIGLIMARRMMLEGAEVLACVELMPYSNGLGRNIVQCLEDYGIPLYLSHTVTRIRGERRLTGVTVSQVDENRRPIAGTEKEFDCDTLLLSVGLIPENELTRAAAIAIDPRTNGPVVYDNMETSRRGVFGCGNVVHVHDLVDFVTAESTAAGAAAADYATKGPAAHENAYTVKNGAGIGYTVPQLISRDADGAGIFFRVRNVYANVAIVAESGGKRIAAFKREHVAPGEMERIVIPKKLLDMCGDEITLYLEGEGVK